MHSTVLWETKRTKQNKTTTTTKHIRTHFTGDRGLEKVVHPGPNFSLVEEPHPLHLHSCTYHRNTRDAEPGQICHQRGPAPSCPCSCGAQLQRCHAAPCGTCMGAAERYWVLYGDGMQFNCWQPMVIISSVPWDMSALQPWFGFGTVCVATSSAGPAPVCWGWAPALWETLLGSCGWV